MNLIGAVYNETKWYLLFVSATAVFIRNREYEIWFFAAGQKLQAANEKLCRSCKTNRRHTRWHGQKVRFHHLALASVCVENAVNWDLVIYRNGKRFCCPIYRWCTCFDNKTWKNNMFFTISREFFLGKTWIRQIIKMKRFFHQSNQSMTSIKCSNLIYAQQLNPNRFWASCFCAFKARNPLELLHKANRSRSLATRMRIFYM